MLPRSAGDVLPSSDAGVLLSVADRFVFQFGSALSILGSRTKVGRGRPRVLPLAFKFDFLN